MTLYKFSVQDNDSVDHELAAFGIEMITNFSKHMDLSQIRRLNEWGRVPRVLGRYRRQRTRKGSEAFGSS